jgi:hypothetical protein
MPLDDPGWGEIVDTPAGGDPPPPDDERRPLLQRPAALVALAVVLLGVGVGGAFAASQLRDEPASSKTRTSSPAKEDAKDDTGKDEPKDDPAKTTSKDEVDPAVEPDDPIEPVDPVDPVDPTVDPDVDLEDPASITMAEYVTQADAVCTRYRDQIAAAQQAAASSGDLGQVTSLVQQEVAGVEAIEVPSSDAAAVADWHAKLDAVVPALQSNDMSAISSTVLAANTAAGQLGMTVCNYGS